MVLLPTLSEMRPQNGKINILGMRSIKKANPDQVTERVFSNIKSGTAKATRRSPVFIASRA